MHVVEAAFREGVSVLAVTSLCCLLASKLMKYDLISLKELFCVTVCLHSYLVDPELVL